jgi:DNA polymerase-4
MRRSGRVGRTVVLRLRFGDYTRASRSRTLPRATAETRAILTAGRRLLRASAATIERRGLTLLGITVANVAPDGGGAQLALPLYPSEEALDAALDEVRDRFGPDSVTRASVLGRDRALSPAVLADERNAR